MSLIAILNGKENPSNLVFQKGSADRLRVTLLSLLGVPLDITGDTISLEFYDKANRSNAVSQSIAMSIGTALAGYATLAFVNATLTLDKGKYFVFIKRLENTGGTYTWSRIPIPVIVK